MSSVVSSIEKEKYSPPDFLEGAERIAWKIGELLREWKASGDVASGYHSGPEPEEVDGRRLGLGIENQFEVLGLNEEVEC